ncbi:endonuclease/exonuclease/phosphatase family metal-dependent hydrolase [Prosthecobacter fusiformis]|uniref:Endonuclease/exonuclease/phosphatase family metal-dependent hydrolase n=1 Tax=Prosthecobacter fusiformis TaxID=48464 RepID=A0A4R7RII7_9BACT|nr:endonuclease/exonuclease/phosphatase family protein [Prosthecobacter fusiformis]TDU63157.1 endonuclease/exonuclease/phosphatase family metal-dependent hydrolase [Prosthecobacter fusiformis]
MKRWLRRLARGLIGCTLVIIGLLAWNLRPPAVGEPTDFAPKAASADSSFTPVRLRVVTWNVWGLLWLTPHRAERLQRVAKEVAALKPDIVAFQEAFVKADREQLITALRGVGLDHSRYFQSGLVGSGLLLVSRFPMESEGFIRYTSNGYPHALTHGDWWAGKGLSLSIVSLPDGTRLYLANTHLHARYKGNRYHTTQLAQSGQLLPWVKRVHTTGWPALWIGDWNTPATSDVLVPLVEAGSWHLLNTEKSRIDHLFGSGPSWEWQVIAQGKLKGHLEAAPEVPWSDHEACWVDVELRRPW